MRFSAIVSVAVTLMGFAAAAPSERATGMQSPSHLMFGIAILTSRCSIELRDTSGNYLFRRQCDCNGVINCCINDCGGREECCNTTCIDRFPGCVNAC